MNSFLDSKIMDIKYNNKIYYEIYIKAFDTLLRQVLNILSNEYRPLQTKI